MFSYFPIFHRAANRPRCQIYPPIVVALQAIGGAAGNMISRLHNVVAAAAVVGLLNREGEVIRQKRSIPILCSLSASRPDRAGTASPGSIAWWGVAVAWPLLLFGIMSLGGKKA